MFQNRLKHQVALPIQAVTETAVITAPEWTGSVAFCTGDCIADDDLTIPGTGEDLESVLFCPDSGI